MGVKRLVLPKHARAVKNIREIDISELTPAQIETYINSISTLADAKKILIKIALVLHHLLRKTGVK